MSRPGGSSQAIGRSKRPSKVVISDSEEEGEPSGSRGRKKLRSHQSEDEEEADAFLDDLDSDGGEVSYRRTSGKGKARAVNGEAHVKREPNHEDRRDEGEEDDDAAPPVRPDQPPSYKREYDRDKDGFVAGAIVRIKMKGFMTYDHVEFRPGPHLNMILGPNGTGKSTIAAAIAIGLGFPPKVMGRANDLKAYVKQGTENAETEIELKGKKGKRNVVIKRRFSRAADKSEWILNGASSTKKAVTDVVFSLGIQANNLCSFLPQDKVAEFAAMAPVTVLKETMRAAGDPRLTAWHEALVEKGDKAKVMENNLEGDIAKRDHHQAAVQRMEPDIQHFRARQGQEEEREILKILLRLAERKLAEETFNEYIVERRKLRAQIRIQKERNRPLNELAERNDRMKQKFDIKTAEAEEAIKGLEKSHKNALRRFGDASRDAEDVDNRLQSLKQELRTKETKKERLRQKIRQSQTVLDQPREDLDEELQSKNQQLRAANRKVSDIKEEDRKVKDDVSSSEGELRELTKALEAKAQDMTRISVLETKRENEAREFDGSIGFLLDWLEANPMKLEGKVHKPPMISVNIRDPRYAWQVEACTSVAQRKTFICESKKDYDLLVGLNKQQYPARRRQNGSHIAGGEVRLNLTLIEVNDASVNRQRPCSAEHLQRLGFDGFAIDFVEADPGVIAFLNMKCNLHSAALTQKQGVSFNPDAVVAAGIMQWITATDHNRATRSAYGSRDVQIMSSGPIPARAFHMTVDQAEVKRIEGEIADVKRRLRDCEQPHAKLKEKAKEMGQKIIAAKQTQEKLNNEMSDLRERAGRFTKAMHELETAKKQLHEMDQGPSGEQQRVKLRAQKLEKVTKLVQPVHDHITATDTALDVTGSRIKYGLSVLQSKVNQDVIQAHLNGGNEELNDLEESMQRVTEKVDEYRHAAAQHFEIAKQMLDATSTDIKDTVQNRMDDVGTPEEVAAQLAGVENDLELSAGIDPNFVARYERIKEELEGYIAAVKAQERDLGILKQQINRILSEFDPALDTLVEIVSNKFSAAFERVGCSGEVKINRVEGDFAAWGINILVSYRNGEGLSVLTQSRQSGGERSLATVTYLMSLSEMARTPFSLVDEINQGMDQRAERNVHNQLVEVTCGSDAGQYFLITPKLLTGLRYHEKMKILIINNGTWIPDSTDKTQRYGDLKACLAKYAQTHSIPAA